MQLSIKYHNNAHYTLNEFRDMQNSDYLHKFRIEKRRNSSPAVTNGQSVPDYSTTDHCLRFDFSYFPASKADFSLKAPAVAFFDQIPRQQSTSSTSFLFPKHLRIAPRKRFIKSPRKQNRTKFARDLSTPNPNRPELIEPDYLFFHFVHVIV